jgi:two-component sensor histidine kinase
MSQRCEQQQAAPLPPPAPASFGTGNGVTDVFAKTSSGELDRIFHALPIGLAVLDSGLRVRRANAVFATFSRRPAWERVGVGRPLEQLLPDFAGPLLPACRAALAGTDDTTSLELTEETEEERPRVWEVRLSRLGGGGRDPAGLAVVVLDVTTQKEEAGRRRLALRELDHRLRNVLAVAQSVFRCTASLSPDKKHLVEAFNGRLDALARASTLLRLERAQGADLAAIVRTALEPFAEGRQLVLDGTLMVLPPRVAGILSLALNELVTNAAKHGALSVLDGRVAVHWHLEDPRRLVLEWREEGGPPVRSPRRRGFGRELIERALSYELDAQVDLQFATDGVRCRIAIPLGEETGLAVRAEAVAQFLAR